MTRKLYIKTFGCQMNEYDSARTRDLLAKSHGLVPTDDPAEADVLLVNTCSVREKAQEKVFSLLGRWKELKAARPGVQIGVGGCVASQEGELIRERAPYVDVVYGPQTLQRVPDLLREAQGANRPSSSSIDISFPEMEKFDRLPLPRADGPTAFLSIMEGCSKYCSFCVVPYTRGEEFSRPLDDVLEEVVALAEQGVREITFLGQNVNAFRGAVERSGSKCDLASLIALAASVDGIDRIRFTTSHPAEFDDALVEAYAAVPELVSHLHLPVQSGSDAVLERMKRGYDVDHFRDRIARLRAVRPDISLSSDFIVGFPGETDADQEATMALIREIGFDTSFSFIYSRRPGTPAADLSDPVPREIKQARLAELQALIESQARDISAAMVGTEQQVLVTGRARKDASEWSGRTANNRVVNFAHDDAGDLLGQFVTLCITEALPNSLRARPFASATAATTPAASALTPAPAVA